MARQAGDRAQLATLDQIAKRMSPATGQRTMR
jgi:hypothetical protein